MLLIGGSNCISVEMLDLDLKLLSVFSVGA